MRYVYQVSLLHLSHFELLVIIVQLGCKVEFWLKCFFQAGRLAI